MARLIWDKDGTGAPDARVQRFLTGDDLACDRVLLPYDVTASRAHAAGLARIGALGADEAAALDAALDRIGVDFARDTADVGKQGEYSIGVFNPLTVAVTDGLYDFEFKMLF